MRFNQDLRTNKCANLMLGFINHNLLKPLEATGRNDEYADFIAAIDQGRNTNRYLGYSEEACLIYPYYEIVNSTDEISPFFTARVAGIISGGILCLCGLGVLAGGFLAGSISTNVDIQSMLSLAVVISVSLIIGCAVGLITFAATMPKYRKEMQRLGAKLLMRLNWLSEQMHLSSNRDTVARITSNSMTSIASRSSAQGIFPVATEVGTGRNPETTAHNRETTDRRNTTTQPTVPV